MLVVIPAFGKELQERNGLRKAAWFANRYSRNSGGIAKLKEPAAFLTPHDERRRRLLSDKGPSDTEQPKSVVLCKKKEKKLS